MKYYKLIKPLPLYEVGDDGFYIDSEGNLQHATASCGEVVYGAKVLVSHPHILTDWFEGIPEKPKTACELKDGDEWYFINYNLSCIQSFREVGNVFLTRKDAEKELARRKAKVILERDTKGFKPDWRLITLYDNNFYMVCYDYYDKSFRVKPSGSEQILGVIYFATKEDAEESIRKHRKEWKAYLGMEE